MVKENVMGVIDWTVPEGTVGVVVYAIGKSDGVYKVIKTQGANFSNDDGTAADLLGAVEELYTGRRRVNYGNQNNNRRVRS